MGRGKRESDTPYRPTPQEVLDVLETMAKPTGAGTITLALDLKRGALRRRVFLRRPARTSPAAVEAALVELERQGVVRSEESRSLLRGVDLLGGGPVWGTGAMWERERRRTEDQQGREQRQSAAWRQEIARVEHRGQWRSEAAGSAGTRSGRDNGGSPLRKAVDATRAENERRYDEWQRRRAGEGGAS
jgi:hypothetical protein